MRSGPEGAEPAEGAVRPFGFSWSFPIYLRLAVEAVRKGVQRVHLVNRHVDGALLGELYTEHGNGKSKPLLLSFCGRSNFSGHGSCGCQSSSMLDECRSGILVSELGECDLVPMKARLHVTR